ncbi:MAG: glycoside hydrolase family 13 protein [Ruminococcaceae bacterium]|nr:glycoside hydrolase family 13 protein [Oscillospiraceae bacterium]
MSLSFQELKTDLQTNRDMSLFGAFSADSKIRFRLRADKALDIKSVVMVIHADGWGFGETIYKKYPLEFIGICDDSAEFAFDVSFAELITSYDLDGDGLFYYHYAAELNDRVVYLGGENPTELTTLKDFIGERQLLIYSSDYKTSESFKDGVIYHIFVDRFKKSGKYPVRDNAVIDKDWECGIPQYAEYPGAFVSNNVFFGGDLSGIAEKIDYIAELGVKTIYLSPIFEAYSNHKYDTGDYLTVDSMFGGEDALRELCSAAESRGIKIILDGVFNHTGDDSVYFNRRGTYRDSVGAYQSENSPYYGWYSFEKYPDEYECWWGVKILPRVDSSNEDYRKFICREVICKWMDAGISGWRLDVADELSDSFLCDLRDAVKEKNPDGVIIGEVWEDATDKVSYGYRRKYLRGGQLDSVMNYPLRYAVIEYIKNGNCDLMRKYTEGMYRRYPKCSSDNLMNFLGTHDTERIFTIFSDKDYADKSNAELATLSLTYAERSLARDRLLLAYSIIAGLPGVPCVFYGDEIGLEGYRDPFCRKPFPWHKVGSDGISTEILEHYRKIGNIRKNHDVFRDGLFRLIALTPDYIVYSREPYSSGDEKVIVCACRRGSVRLEFSDYARFLAGGERYVRGYTVSENEAIYFSMEKDTVIDAIY